MRNIILVLVLIIMLAGCSLPNDTEFMEVVKSLDTPEKIGNYMLENFEYKTRVLYIPNPYTLWKTKQGDCNDFSTFGIFIANYHGYEAYQVNIYFHGIPIVYHAIAVYEESGKLNYSTNQEYVSLQADSIEDVINHYDNWDYRYKVRRYEVK